MTLAWQEHSGNRPSHPLEVLITFTARNTIGDGVDGDDTYGGNENNEC